MSRCGAHDLSHDAAPFEKAIRSSYRKQACEWNANTWIPWESLESRKVLPSNSESRMARRAGSATSSVMIRGGGFFDWLKVRPPNVLSLGSGLWSFPGTASRRVGVRSLVGVTVRITGHVGVRPLVFPDGVFPRVTSGITSCWGQAFGWVRGVTVNWGSGLCRGVRGSGVRPSVFLGTLVGSKNWVRS